MEVFPRITVEAGKCAGRPCIRGHRLTVEHLLALLAQGATFPDLKQEWDFLEPEDIAAAMLSESRTGQNRLGFARFGDENQGIRAKRQLHDRAGRGTMSLRGPAAVPGQVKWELSLRRGD